MQAVAVLFLLVPFAVAVNEDPCKPQVEPCGTIPPTAPPATAPPTAPPTPPPTTPPPTAPPTMAIKIPNAPPPGASPPHAVCLSNLTTSPGAFTPWVVHKFLKVNAPFVSTTAKQINGAQSLHIYNAQLPIYAGNFTCVKEDDEWKARMANPAYNILTMELDDGMGWAENPDGKSGKAAPRPVLRCALQDLSLYRSRNSELGLRIDYGHCQHSLDGVSWFEYDAAKVSHTNSFLRTTAKQTFIMIGVRRVKAGEASAHDVNLGGFFKGVCRSFTAAETVGGTGAVPLFDTTLNIAKSVVVSMENNNTIMHRKCPAVSADMERVQPLEPGCFYDYTAFTALNSNNGFPALDMSEEDYDYLLSKLPFTVKDDPCDFPNKRIYGHVVMDRVCLDWYGMGCDAVCESKFCSKQELLSVTTNATVFTTPPICIDCPWSEAIYGFYATLATVCMTWWTMNVFESSITKRQRSSVQRWKHNAAILGAEHETEGIGSPSGELVHHHVRWCSGVSCSWYVIYFFIVGFWTCVCYYWCNLLDWAYCVLTSQELCIKILPFHFLYPSHGEGWIQRLTREAWETKFATETIDIWHRGGLMFYYWGYSQVDYDLHIDVCWTRLFGLIVVTWFTVFWLCMFWRWSQKKIEIVDDASKAYFAEEHALLAGGSGGAGAMNTAKAAQHRGSSSNQQGFLSRLFHP